MRRQSAPPATNFLVGAARPSRCEDFVSARYVPSVRATSARRSCTRGNRAARNGSPPGELTPSCGSGDTRVGAGAGDSEALPEARSSVARPLPACGPEGCPAARRSPMHVQCFEARPGKSRAPATRGATAKERAAGSAGYGSVSDTTRVKAPMSTFPPLTTHTTLPERPETFSASTAATETAPPPSAMIRSFQYR